MNSPDQRKELNKIIDHHVTALSEYFDNVQILCSSVEEGGETTLALSAGSGNWMSRIGQAKEWIIYHDQRVRFRACRDEDNDDDSDA